MTTPSPRPGLPVRAYQRHPARTDIALWLDGNEGPAAVARHLGPQAQDAECLRRYPEEAPLRTALAQHFGLDQDQVVLGAGADELLDRLCRGFLAPGRRLLTPIPCFAMLPHYTALAGGELVGVPWSRGSLPLRELQALLPTAAVVVLTSPNNPTGLCATTAELLTLITAAPQTLFVVDLAYVEFARHDPTPALLQLPNVVVVRTFSKAYGLAGLRVGYALGPAELLRIVRICGSPYPCAGPSLSLCLLALQRGPDPASLQTVARGREQLAQRLTGLGFDVVPSEANFVLAHTGSPLAARAFAEQLARRGIAVRTFDPDDPQLADAVRTSVPGEPTALQKLLDAIAATRLRTNEPTPGECP